MPLNYTTIATGAALNAVTFNNALTELDNAIKLNNYAAAVAPTVGDDSADGYTIGSRWIDTTADRVYIAVDVTVGAAVWKEVSFPAGLTGNFALLGNLTVTGLIYTVVGGAVCFDTAANFWRIQQTIAGVNGKLNFTKDGVADYMTLSGTELDINGALFLRATKFLQFDNTTNFWRISQTVAGSTGKLQFSQNGVLDVMTLTGTGRLGIGTASPGSKLSVVGLPTSSAGLATGDIWANSNVLTVVP